jgi:chromosome segregation ATPase
MVMKKVAGIAAAVVAAGTIGTNRFLDHQAHEASAQAVTSAQIYVKNDLVTTETQKQLNTLVSEIEKLDDSFQLTSGEIKEKTAELKHLVKTAKKEQSKVGNFKSRVQAFDGFVDDFEYVGKTDLNNYHKLVDKAFSQLNDGVSTDELEHLEAKFDDLKTRYNGIADNSHTIEGWVSQVRTLSTDPYLDDTNKASLDTLLKQATDYTTFGAFSKSFKTSYARVEKAVAAKATSAKNDTIKMVNALLANSYLDAADKSKLEQKVKTITSLSATDTGTLADQIKTITADYNTAKLSAEKAEAEAKQKAEEEAKQKAAEEAAAKAQANQTQGIVGSNNGGSSSSSSSPSKSGGWTRAASGYVFVSDSNIMYHSVKKPGNFAYMTESAARSGGARQPIRSNGWAKW